MLGILYFSFGLFSVSYWQYLSLKKKKVEGIGGERRGAEWERKKTHLQKVCIIMLA